VVEDHTVPTLAGPVVFTTHPVQNWLTDDEPELPFLSSIQYPVETMPHLPSERASGVGAFSRRIAFTLANVPYGGFATLYEFLTQSGRLDRAKLLLQSLIVPPREMGAADAHRSFINGRLSAGDQIEYFEGIVDRVISVGDEIQCSGKTDLPTVDWKLVPDTGGDPRDRGSKIPIPLGKNAIVKCSNLLVGATAVVNAPVHIADTTIPIGFESFGNAIPDSGSGMLGAEAVSGTGRSGFTLTGVTRGEVGSLAANHITGTALIELATIALGVADRTISAITKLYVRSDTTGALIVLNDLLYTVNYDDESTAPGASGAGITSITMTPAQVGVIVAAVVSEAAVTTQAEYSDSAPTIDTDIDDTITADNTLVSASSGATGNWTAHTTAPTFTYVKGGGSQQNLRTAFTNRLAGTAQGKLASARFGFDITVNTLTQTTITVGLIVTGAEASLVGVADGTVVASYECTATGAVTDIWGPLFAGAATGTVGDLYDVLVDVAHGEVGGGTPTVAYTIDDTRIEVTYYSDSVDSSLDTSSFLSYASGASFSESSPYWKGHWNDESLGFVGMTRDDTESREGWRFTIASDPLGSADPEFGASMEDGVAYPQLRFIWNGNVANSTSSVSVEFEAIGDWSSFCTTPALTTETANANTFNNVTLLTLTGVQRNVRSSDMVGLQFEIRISGGQDGDRLSLTSVAIRALYAITDPDYALTERIVDAEIQASAGGIGLEFYALCDGPVAPDIQYQATIGNLMTNPRDLIQYWLREVGGYSAADMDLTSFAAASYAMKAGAGGVEYKWGFDARNLGGDFQSILARMTYESRINLVRPSGEQWTMLRAGNDFAFTAPTLTVDSLSDVLVIGKDDADIRTRLTVNFGFDPRFDDASNSSFLEVQTTDPTASAVVDREEEFGRLDDDPRFLLCHTADGAAGVTDWRGYYQQELGRPARLIAARVDWWQGAALEIGDMRNVNHPKLGTSDVKCRVIEVNRSQTSGIQARFIEVL
jgi:hypothetical protein